MDDEVGRGGCGGTATNLSSRILVSFPLMPDGVFAFPFAAVVVAVFFRPLRPSIQVNSRSSMK
jgi:hypothetical protein